MAVSKTFLSILLATCAFTIVSSQISLGRHRDAERAILGQILDPKAYDASLLPGGRDAGAINVAINMYVRSIIDMDDKKHEMTIQLTFRQQWNDRRLNFSSHPSYPGESFKYVTVHDLKRIWRPDVFFSNSREENLHDFIQPNSYARVSPNGDVLLSQRVTLTLGCPMSLKNHPFDKQTCIIRLASYGYTTDDIIFVWKAQDPVQLTKELHMREFWLNGFTTDHCDAQTNTGVYSCLRADFEFTRGAGLYFRQVFIPLTMFVIAAYLVFWLDARNILPRLILSISTLYVATSFIANVNSALPQVSYTKALDGFTGICLTFLFSTVIETVIVHNLLRGENSENRRNDGQATGEQDSEFLHVDDSRGGQFAMTAGKFFDPRNFRSYLAGVSTTSQKIDAVFKVFYPLLFLVYSMFFFLTAAI